MNIPYKLTEKVLRPRVVVARLGISMATLYRWQQTRPDFPRKIKMGKHSVGFLESELIAWINANAESSPVQTPDIGGHPHG